MRLLGACLRPCASAIRRFRGDKWSVCATGLSMGMIQVSLDIVWQTVQNDIAATRPLLDELLRQERGG